MMMSIIIVPYMLPRARPLRQCLEVPTRVLVLKIRAPPAPRGRIHDMRRGHIPGAHDRLANIVKTVV